MKKETTKKEKVTALIGGVLVVLIAVGGYLTYQKYYGFDSANSSEGLPTAEDYEETPLTGDSMDEEKMSLTQEKIQALFNRAIDKMKSLEKKEEIKAYYNTSAGSIQKKVDEGVYDEATNDMLMSGLKQMNIIYKNLTSQGSDITKEKTEAVKETNKSTPSNVQKDTSNEVTKNTMKQETKVTEEKTEVQKAEEVKLEMEIKQLAK